MRTISLGVWLWCSFIIRLCLCGIFLWGCLLPRSGLCFTDVLFWGFLLYGSFLSTCWSLDNNFFTLCLLLFLFNCRFYFCWLLLSFRWTLLSAFVILLCLYLYFGFFNGYFCVLCSSMVILLICIVLLLLLLCLCFLHWFSCFFFRLLCILLLRLVREFLTKLSCEYDSH